MRILDAHAHLGTWGDFLIPRPDAEHFAQTMAEHGVEAAGVSHLLGVGHDAATGNRLVLDAVAAHPGRLYAWLVASPHDGDPAQVREDLECPGVWGLKLHPDTHQVRLDDPRYEAWFVLAEQAGVPVLTHTQTGSPWSDPALAAEVARRHPTTPLLMGHAGLDEWNLLGAARLARDVDNLYVETCSSRLTRRWLVRVAAEAGADKTLYGTDAVFLDPRMALGRLLAADLTPADRALVAGGNLARLLGDRLPPEGAPR